MPEAEDEPGDRREHAEVPESANDAADFLVLGEETPLGEENGPVAFIGADQRQDGGAGVGHVGADVRKIFEEPENAEGETGGFALEEKVGGAEQRDDEFTKGSSEDVDGLAEPTKEEVAAFVDDQIGIVENEKAGTVGEGVEEEKSVETEPSDSREAGDGFPIAEFVFEKGHLGKGNKRDSDGKAVQRKSVSR